MARGLDASGLLSSFWLPLGQNDRGGSSAHFSRSASELLVDHLIEIMAVLNLSNASSHLGFRSCVTLRRMHRDGQLDDYLRDGVD